MKQKTALALGAVVLALGGLGWFAMEHMPAGCDTACVQRADDGGTGNGGLPTRPPDDDQ